MQCNLNIKPNINHEGKKASNNTSQTIINKTWIELLWLPCTLTVRTRTELRPRFITMEANNHDRGRE